MATLTVYPDADPESTSVEGYVGKGGTNITWATIRDATDGTESWPSAPDAWMVRLTSGTSAWNAIFRLFHLYDTSALGASASISAATISLWPTSINNQWSLSIHICSSNPATNTNLVNADYDQVGSTSFGSKTIASMTTGAYNDWDLNNDGINNIAKTGVSKFGGRDSADINNNEPSFSASQSSGFTGYNVGEAGTSKDPKLVITYTVTTFIPSIMII